jgi:hypothetical protein
MSQSMPHADPATARTRPARLAGDIRAKLYQAIADLAEIALWLPGQFVCEHDRAADILARLSGDLARAATALRGWPAYPPDWPAHSYSAATALAVASQHEPDLAAWLAGVLSAMPRGQGDRLATAVAVSSATVPGGAR